MGVQHGVVVHPGEVVWFLRAKCFNLFFPKECSEVLLKKQLLNDKMKVWELCSSHPLGNINQDHNACTPPTPPPPLFTGSRYLQTHGFLPANNLAATPKWRQFPTLLAHCWASRLLQAPSMQPQEEMRISLHLAQILRLFRKANSKLCREVSEKANNDMLQQQKSSAQWRRHKTLYDE